ncbi:DUF2625 domain-containing protein [Streptomyces sp. NPDC059695]|uniref:DUF2625 domain-containing protein n=1 Tax=Streptomyces sp. NPDC059695 TaxID=3346910 RepID=UPI00367F7257
MRELRGLDELTEVEDPAWPRLQEELRASKVPVEVLEADPGRAEATLLTTQVTVRSYLGAFVLHAGGMLVDDGWLRVYGSPAAHNDRRLPGLARVNGYPDEPGDDWRPAAGLVVAHDVLGGAFAIQGGTEEDTGLPGRPGEMVYFAPDSLRWDAIGAGYGAWLSWLLAGGTEEFYEGLRWPGWRDEVPGLTGGEGLSFYPPLWSVEAHQDLAGTSRAVVPLAELLGFGRETALGLDGTDPGFLGTP